MSNGLKEYDTRRVDNLLLNELTRIVLKRLIIHTNY